MKELAPGVWIEHCYESGNVGCIVTGAGVVCIDAPMMPDDARHWLHSIRDVTDEAIIALVQTDYDQARVLSTRHCPRGGVGGYAQDLQPGQDHPADRDAAWARRQLARPHAGHHIHRTSDPEKGNPRDTP